MRWLLLGILLLLMNVANAESRYALLIANQNYPTPQKDLNIFGGLETPVSEMRELSKVLQDYDFTVTEVKDANLDEMSSAINRFVSKLQPGDVGLLYYAGHGAQVKGENYLIPVSKKFADATDVKNGAYLAQSAIDKLSGSSARVKLVFLDSCRNQLLMKEKGRGFSDPGFAKMDAKGVVISYGAALGQIAADNITYTSQLVKAIQSDANQPIELVLSKAQELTAQATGGQQIPWYEKGMVGKFCFGTCKKATDDDELVRLREENERLKRLQNATDRPSNMWLNPNTNILVTIAPQPSKGSEDEDADGVADRSDLCPSTLRSARVDENGCEFVTKSRVLQSGKSFRDELKDGSLGPEMVWIPGGKFEMGGSGFWDDNEKPVHTVSVRSFAMGKYEVTFEEYDKFCDATGWNKPRDQGWGRGKRPVINVSWNDAKAYAKWLSEQTGKNYRLPSEAQWEYACREGSTGKYTFYAWYWDNSGGQTHPVGEKQANKFGLYDVHGNALEWLEDVWHSSYEGAPTDGSAWLSGGDSNRRILRGGSWLNDSNYLSCTYRDGYTTILLYNYYGFRLSRM